MRGIGEQELDPLGADAGTFATSVPPTETAIVSYGDSYNPAHPNFSYTVDGIRVPVESFVAFLGVKLHDPLGLLEDWARASSKPIAYRNVGVRWGEKYDVMYDANYNLVSNASIYDPALRGVSFGVEYAIYSDAELDLTLLPQNAGQVLVPIKGVDGLKTLMQNRLDYGDCRDAVNRVVAQLGQNARTSNRPDNQPTFGGVMDVFDKIASAGGIRVNVRPTEYPPGQRVPGGSGYSWREPVRLNNVDVRWDMKTWVYIKGGYSDSPPLAFDRLPYDYGITGIHEMLHQISKYMYTEEELNQAGRDLGGTDIDDYLKKHCSPAQYR